MYYDDVSQCNDAADDRRGWWQPLEMCAKHVLVTGVNKLHFDALLRWED
jgi:hypothetical protein